MDKKFDHKKFLPTVSTRPGVYQMIGPDSSIIYVGKARNLRKRVTSYFRASGLESKTLRMVEKIQTGSEKTPFMKFGDKVSISVFDDNNNSIFGTIEQTFKKK